MKNLIRAGLLAMLALAFSSPVLADAKSELMAAYQKQIEAKSYRMRMQADANTTLQMDYVAPDSWRMQVSGQETIITGGRAYMMINGQAMTIPMDINKMTEKYRSAEGIKAQADKITIEDSGSGEVNGEAATWYLFSSPEARGERIKAWISEESGYPIRMETGSGKRATVMDIYDYNANIRISAPR